MLTKTAPVFIKTVTQEGDQGVVEMVVSTYGKDSWGDKVVPGAFTETLAEWKASGDPIPFIFAHQHDDPMMYIGTVLDAYEQGGDPTTTPPTPAGLYIKAANDMDDQVSIKAFKLMKSRRVKQASFCYDVLDGGAVTVDGETVYELRKLKLYEVGPCLIGMNQETELISTKNFRAVAAVLRDAKIGRTISAANEELLRSAHEAIGTVLSTLDGGGDPTKSGGPASAGAQPTDPPTAGADGPGKADDPSGKADDPTLPDLASLDLLDLELQLLNVETKARQEA